MQDINSFIDENIRPFLQRDGGDLEIVSYEKDVLTIKYEGACGGCPHAAMGTLRYIETALKEEFNPNITVKLAQ